MNPSESAPEHIELTIVPIPPDTVASVKAELEQKVEAALREAGRESLLADGQIQIEIEQTFPTDQVIIVGVTLLSGVALETIKEVALPYLKKWVEVKIKQARKRKGKSGKTKSKKK
jgi:hypothetical protein